MEKQQKLYQGKAKTLYSTQDKDYLIVEFRDDTSAFNGEKLAQLSDKGATNNRFNAFIMQKLADAGIPVHFEKQLSQQESLVKHLSMIPLECVIRNISAGSLCKRLGLEEGLALNPSTYELFLKNDPLGDPMVNESLALTFGWANEDQLKEMKGLTYAVNEILTPLFLEANLLLVDYKLEFGMFHGEVVLGDEFTPDGCRIWDKDTREKLDKDRFRKDLGSVVESYKLVAERLQI